MLKKIESWKMFNRISGRYDLLNRLLSMRCDVYWRKKCVSLLPVDRPLTVLDLATGTTDVIQVALRRRPNIKTMVGIDPAEKMLRIGRRKKSKKQRHLVNGDAHQLPLTAHCVDAVTIAFGIRNMANMDQALFEIKRSLMPGGHLIILEFSLPHQPLVRTLYLWYFRHMLPIMGRLISGDPQAYSYLNQSVESFPYGDAFGKVLRNAGFEHVYIYPLTFGIATVYHARNERRTI